MYKLYNVHLYMVNPPYLSSLDIGNNKYFLAIPFIQRVLSISGQSSNTPNLQ